MTKITRAVLFVSIFALFTLIVFPAAAQIKTVNCGGLGITCTSDADGLKNSIISIVNIFLGLVGLVAVIVIIYAGVKYILARDEAKEASQAKTAILYAVIGLIVIGLAAAIVNFVLVGIAGGSPSAVPGIP